MNKPPEFTPDVATSQVGRALAHDSAELHVQGSAPYIDDMREPAGTVHLAPGYAKSASGQITGVDLSAVEKAPGVVAVLTAKDIPGVNDCSPAMGDDPILADGDIFFHGQVVFAVVAGTRDEARRAARLGKITIDETKPAVTVEDGEAAGENGLARLRIPLRITARCARYGHQQNFRFVAHWRPGTFLS